MRILHLYKDYFPVEGGIENHIKHLAEAQAARGHQVSVLVTSRDRRTHVETINGVRVLFAARLATVSSAPISPAMFALLRREQPSIVHLHSPYPWGEVANYLFGRANSTVMTYHSDIIRQKYLRVVYAPLMQRVLARVDRIIVTSPNYLESSPVLARWKEKCTLVPLGIDPSLFEKPAPRADQIRAQVGAGPDTFLLLFVGHLRYYKGVNYLLAALPQLPTVKLVIVGSGPMENAWRSMASKMEIAHRVIFVGQVADEELPSYYQASDVFVLPSSERSEAFGLVQLEAMASGKPVVCTELGTGTSFVNLNGETGFVVPARDSRALASAIQRLVGDAALRARMGAAGRARVHEQFRLDRMVDQVLELYNNLISGDK